ncbi:MAG TPA: heparinase II/III family protein, partial [Armatimonadota bacterium]
MKFRLRTLTTLSLGLNIVILGALAIFSPSVAQAETAAGVRGSVFFPPKLMETARVNATKDPWAARLQKALIESPAPWMKYTDDELWEMMFGNTIKRAWMVWSNGYCPACKKDVPMYNWTADPLAHPWKMRCPHCNDYFPKNDFAAFYRSGLDSHNIFDPKLADRRLLFNSDHPDPKDPLYRFGVDDGEGYVEGDKRWRFVGAYTIRGQWKIAVLVGIQSLASAYTVTGDKAYAHKALILLDRVADLYPTFDYKKQGTVYERVGVSDGYVSVWHDACSETRILAEAYDRVRGELNNDPELVSFLAAKAKKFGLSNPKSSPEDVRRNIEDRILRDTLEHREKTDSNYPQTDMTFAIMNTVLGWPDNRKEVETAIDQMIEKSAAFDGLSGEKGLAAYSSFSPQAIAQLLGMYSRIDPSFLKNALKRHPRLYQMFRFYIDTRCLNLYYPDVGDSGAFGTAVDRYLGVGFSQWPGLNPSMYSFMGQLYQATGDPDFALEAYNGNGGSTKDLPFDLFANNPSAFQKMIADVAAKQGRYPKVSSVNKQEWHLGILRSGKDANARALWMQYDSVGTHGHANGMNLGLYAKGLDLMPEFGYPPVQFGGWDSPRATWYTMSAAHNTVVVDGLSHRPSEMSGIGVAKTAA